MDNMLKLQLDIKNSSEEMRTNLKSVYDWEDEMKQKEKQLLKGGQCEEVAVPPIRSLPAEDENYEKQNESLQLPAPKNSENIHHDELSQVQQKANASKERGNSCVKLGKFEDAIYYYTDAINHFDNDSVFYSNRALCYLKLNKYAQCIDDCNKAININKSCLKAYYRRMQANECLGENEKAVKDCQMILKIDPKNTETRKYLERINKKIQTGNYQLNILKPKFTIPNENINEIKGFNKPAHMRSKKALKRILISETHCLQNNKSNDNTNISISDDVIEKLFNNNDVGSYTEVKKSNKIQDRTPIEDLNIENVTIDKIKDKIEKNLENEKLEFNREISTEKKLTQKYNELIANHIELSYNKDRELTIPVNSIEFHITWKELSPSQRFRYLKSINVSNLNKLFGPGLEPDFIPEIFTILKDFYMKENLEIIDILLEISNHGEFSILSTFLSEENRKVVSDFITYMNERKNNPKVIENIEVSYYFKPYYD